MAYNFNFQINPNDNRKPWDKIEAYKREFPDRTAAVLFAQRVARIFKCEVRLTEGTDAFTTSGAYFRNNE